MKANYCTHCGERLKENAKYCQRCGMYIASRSNRTYDYHYEIRHEVSTPKRLPLSCILAYIPTLFWIPLATDSEDDTHRKCANQGLWLTILSVVFGVGLIALGIILIQTDVLELMEIDKLFTDWTVFNWQQRIPAALFCQAILPFILFVPVNSTFGLIHGMVSIKPYRIPIVGRFKLI